ncbi:virulence factor [Pelagicoccus sp. SDUM812003]|uniref:virulence factor n=1 Tax=Pelagicoccus sp. SDUM812003 TaxID=3041267 RepID=UPI00280E57A1|nr:virulence factor [Pelagicoccus sp. SDUM812003]MDQ8201946.1 virulence factor [Pelagicoccus sp. SDUM812003]
MAHYQILYWQDIPTQVKAWDEFDEAKAQLDPTFMKRVDARAQKEGKTDSASYLGAFKWSEPQERPGEADDVADEIKEELEAKLL